MSRLTSRRFLLRGFLLSLITFGIHAQVNTGSIIGDVRDAQGLAVPDAEVTLISARTADQRTTRTSDAGGLAISALPAGEYTLKISKAGFQSFERKGIILTSNERLSAGAITLAVGSTTETVTVSADTAVVQTASAENSALLESKQISMTLTRGRDVLSLLRLMPGVSQNSDPNSLGGEIGSSAPNIGGLRNTDSTVALDGQVSSDSDNVNVAISAVSIDFIDEVKILANNFQAEYGRNAGAQVNIISKSGGREFHGGASWFKRHEQFNANNFFNNLNGLPKPLYRYNTWTGTIGGPITIPKLFNQSREKLFFFYGHEHWLASEPQAVQRTTMPTALERSGDFSQTLDLNGRVVTIIDPATGQPFPGNRIPSNRINQHGLAILNLFPQPNFLDRSISRGNYNYQYQDIRGLPKNLDQAKVDCNMTPNDRLTGRWRHWRQGSTGYTVVAGFSSTNFDLLYHQYAKTEDSGSLNYSRTLSPTMVNEFSFSFRKIGEIGPPVSETALDRVTRSKVGLGSLPRFYPAANPLNVIPAASFGGVPSAPAIGYDNRFWITAGDTRWSIADNWTWNRSQHMIKAGFYYEFNISDEGDAANCFSGCFNFSSDANNPLNSNYAFANALLGNFQSYSESSIRNFRGGEDSLAEWFVQDSWRISRRLTLEVGARFSWFSPWIMRPNQKGAAWVQERFDPKQAVTLYRPARNPSGQRVAQNPITGEYAPAVYIGALVPGVGNPINGMVPNSDPAYIPGWQNSPGIQVVPRFGFAWDVFGNGRTAVRGGFGITKQTQINSAYANNLVAFAPPIVVQPTTYYQNIENLAEQSGVLFPTNSVRTFELDYKPASVYNYSLGVQQNIGFDTVVGISYVGNQGKHLLQNRNLNTLPYGTLFLPSSGDPTNPGRPLPDSFLVPYVGYQTVQTLENSGLSNYNSLQVTGNRRFSKGLQFGAAWTWSKTMNLSDGPANIPMFLSSRTWLYGKAGFDQTHMLVLNYLWDIPKGSKLWPNPFTRLALDDWQLSGFTTFASGFPSGIGFTTTDNADITGGGDGSRLMVTGKAQLSHGERTFYRWFDPTVFARPQKENPGNAPKDVVRGPGMNNWDISLFKNFRLGAESCILQFRSEFYNAFNHTQFSGVDTTARFDTAGNQVNSRLGQVTAARSARVIQFALALRF